MSGSLLLYVEVETFLSYDDLLFPHPNYDCLTEVHVLELLISHIYKPRIFSMKIGTKGTISSLTKLTRMISWGIHITFRS
jgi:hypothetical protein